MYRWTRWFDTDHHTAVIRERGVDLDRRDWLRCTPFFLMHLAALGVFVTGWSRTSLFAALGLYLVRMFGIAGVYHRYFAHRAYRTSRPAQFALALLGASAAQRGPLWWASIHREHHRESDTENDPHSPVLLGALHAYLGWFLSSRWYATNYRRVPDLVRYPELVWLNRFDTAVPAALALLTYLTGLALQRFAPSLHVTAMQFFLWAFVISTLMVFHATSSINAFGHLFGRQRYDTNDSSRNNALLALLVIGEGWHNNHHRYMSSARAGFYWWEFDPTYYVLKVLSWLGIIWDLKPVPAAAYEQQAVQTAQPAQ
ncbi:MAG: acyl-CoA desaturase [Acidobacteria bacterium]|nr:acyl-CoA desaturase [Acidobacteriota bacterium]MBV9478516.1 acyl-CoA desaturase [Acidobacteriota bacterium]